MVDLECGVVVLVGLGSLGAVTWHVEGGQRCGWLFSRAVGVFWGLLGRDIARRLRLAEVGEGWFYAERGGLTWLALGVSAGIRVCGCLMMWRWVIPPRRCWVLLRCLCWAHRVFVGPSVSSLVHSIHGVLDGVGPQPPQ